MMPLILSFFACLLIAFAPLCSCSCSKVMACYFTDWSPGRPGKGSYDITKIDVCNTKCSHLLYAFAKYDIPSNGLVIVDMDKGYVPILTKCSEKGKVVLLAVGGWTYSKAEMITPLFKSYQTIDGFVENALQFVINNHFQGMDLDLEFPGYWQMDPKSPPDGKEKFSYLVEKLSKRFKEKRLLLTVAVSANPELLDVSYDVEVLNKHVDWIGLMAYDYYSYNDKRTGLCAPLRNQPKETRKWNVEDSLALWLKYGASPHKVLMGLPLYGKTFTLDDENENGLDAPASEIPVPGQFTQEAGVLSYQEICLHIKQDNWIEVYKKNLGAYAYRKKDWVGYDNIQSLEVKAELIVEKKLMGAMVWELGFDDFNDSCGSGAYPMLTAFQNTISKYDGSQNEDDSIVKDD